MVCRSPRRPAPGLLDRREKWTSEHCRQRSTLRAASAWETLAAELYSTATSYQSAITELTAGPWLGPAAATMAATAAPYVAWLRIAAEQAEQAGNQAIAAAAAYEATFAETVPPPVVAANRALLAALIAANFFGQNTSAIATTEAQYSEMWAQDAGAMQSYATSSAAATSLTPFQSPSPSTSSDGSAFQAEAVAQSAGASAGSAQRTVQQAITAVPAAITNLASPADAFGFGGRDLLGLLADLSAVFLDPEIGAAGLAADTSLGVTALPYDVGGYWTGVHTDDIVSGWAGIEPWPGNAPTPPTTFPVVTNPAASVSAWFGHAPSVGRLSVPPAWAAAAPELRAMTTALPAATVGAAAQATGSSAGVCSARWPWRAWPGARWPAPPGEAAQDSRNESGCPAKR
nr:PPE domain-containing protein [Mycobacterium genavense]